MWDVFSAKKRKNCKNKAEQFSKRFSKIIGVSWSEKIEIFVIKFLQ